MVAAGGAALDPVSARIAVARLANPVAPPEWPRHTHLELGAPVDRVARGQVFEVEVIDQAGARLPDDLQIEYRFLLPDGSTTVQREPMRRRNPAIAFARRESVTRPFAYRAVGGDDHSMPWIEVAIAEPPAIEELALRLSPPGYSGFPPHTAEKHLRILKGSTLAISGRANKPLDSLLLHLDDREPIAAILDESGLRFRIPAPGESEPAIDAPGAYWFELADRDGLRSETPPWDLQVVPDPPPTVTIEQPSASLFVTPEAVIPVRVVAKDNLAVRRISLRHRRGSAGGLPEGQSLLSGDAEGTLVLYEGLPEAPPAADGRRSPLDSPGDHRVVETRWALEPLQLQPGTQWILTATADDYQPASGVSPPVRLSIITRRELDDRLAARQNLIVAELRRVLEMQRSARGRVAELAVRLGELAELSRPDLDHLQAAELTQRRIEDELTGKGDSIPGYVTALMTDLDNNRLDRPDVRRRMQSLLAELERAGRDDLPPIRHELTTAIKSAQAEGAPPGASWPADPAVGSSLLAAAAYQDRVMDTLDGILKDLGRWDNYRRFYHEVGRILREQEDLGARTKESSRRTMGRDRRDLPPADVADLRVLGVAQTELARQLDRMGADMNQVARDLDVTDPLAADTIADAVDEIRRRSISGLMRTSGTHLEQNHIGQAVAVQRQVRAALQDVLDILANRREHELERLISRLREIETELADMLRRQADTTAGFHDAAQDERGEAAQTAESRRRLQTLGDRQSGLAEEASRAARRLARLLAQEAARSVAQAGEKMAAAARDAASERAATGAEQAAQAQELLELAYRQLETRRRMAQAELVAEQLARLEDAVRELHDAEQGVIDEARQFDRLADSPGGLTRSHLADLQDLVGLQLAIQGDTEQLRGKLIGAETVQLVLDRAAEYMVEVATRLRQHQTGNETQQAAIRARDTLAMLLEAFQTDPADPSQAPIAGDAGTGANGDPVGEPIPAAEVKLLKLLQQDLNRRTAELAESAPGRNPASNGLQGQVERLAKEQGQLADLTLGLVVMPGEQERVSEDAHPLLEVAQRMRDVQSRLAQEATDEQTTAMQEHIVKQLDILLEQARNQALASAEGAPQAAPSMDQQSSPATGEPPDADRDPTQAPAREATDKPGAAESIEERPDPWRTLHAMERLWNQLPQRQREQLLQMAPEQFLPKYELEIEHYFRRLSEEQARP